MKPPTSSTQDAEAMTFIETLLKVAYVICLVAPSRNQVSLPDWVAWPDGFIAAVACDSNSCCHVSVQSGSIKASAFRKASDNDSLLVSLQVSILYT